METNRYSISVQWGKGRHYFISTALTNHDDAVHRMKSEEVCANKTYELNGKRGAKPIIHMWQRVYSTESL